MGIILLTELGKTPWQLRFSPFSLLPAVSQLRLPLDTDPPLDTIPVVPSASPTGAPRAFLPTGDTVDTDTVVFTRGRLRLLTMAAITDPVSASSVSAVPTGYGVDV